MPNGYLKKGIPYPPIHVFPRNPDIAKWIAKKRVIDTNKEEGASGVQPLGSTLSSKVNYLEFTSGPEGKNNIIRLSSSPYIDYTYYNWEDNLWHRPPIELVIMKADTEVQATDISNYIKPRVVGFGRDSASIFDNLSFYFDGEKLITNYDFANPADRDRIEVRYWKLTDTLKVKAVLMANSPGVLFNTPTVDQYTLVVGKQKVSG